MIWGNYPSFRKPPYQLSQHWVILWMRLTVVNMDLATWTIHGASGYHSLLHRRDWPGASARPFVGTVTSNPQRRCNRGGRGHGDPSQLKGSSQESVVFVMKCHEFIHIFAGVCDYLSLEREKMTDSCLCSSRVLTMPFMVSGFENSLLHKHGWMVCIL